MILSESDLHAFQNARACLAAAGAVLKTPPDTLLVRVQQITEEIEQLRDEALALQPKGRG